MRKVAALRVCHNQLQYCGYRKISCKVLYNLYTRWVAALFRYPA